MTIRILVLGIGLGLMTGCASGDFIRLNRFSAGHWLASASPATDQIRRSDDEQLFEHAGDLLPLPAGLAPQVAFWKKVYSRWGFKDVALHDDRYLDLIYEMIELPGPPSDHYNRLNRAYVRGKQRVLAERLTLLEYKVKFQLELTPDEKRLVEKITDTVGAHAIVGASERLRSQRGLRQRFAAGIRTSGRYMPIFESIFAEVGVPIELALLPHVESSFQLLARSSAGAAGLWQFTRPTGRLFMRVDSRIDERLDPIAAARAAARLLQDNYRRLGSWPHAVTAYNHGVGGMHKAMQQFGADFTRMVYEYDGRAFGFASRNFYAEFLAARVISRDAPRYFPGLQMDEPIELSQVVLDQPLSVAEIGLRYSVPREQLLELNRAWLSPVTNGTYPVPVGALVWLPGERDTVQEGIAPADET